MRSTSHLQLTGASPRAVVTWSPGAPTLRMCLAPSLPCTRLVDWALPIAARPLPWHLSQPRPVHMGTRAVPCTGQPRPDRGHAPSPTELAGYCSSSPDRLWPPTTPCFKCFRRFGLMFQVLRLDVAKVDLGCCICCIDNIRMLQAYVLSVSDVCFKCFI
jgi:hypothetical protein